MCTFFKNIIQSRTCCIFFHFFSLSYSRRTPSFPPQWPWLFSWYCQYNENKLDLFSYLTPITSCMCMLSCFSHVWLFTPWAVAPRLLCPWDSPGQNTGLGYHFLLRTRCIPKLLQGKLEKGWGKTETPSGHAGQGQHLGPSSDTYVPLTIVSPLHTDEFHSKSVQFISKCNKVSLGTQLTQLAI